MSDNLSTKIFYIGIFVVNVLVGVLLVVYFANNRNEPVDEDLLNYANLLRTHEVYQDAVDNYISFLKQGGISDEREAKIRYVVGDIQREYLKQYQKAIASYLRVMQLLESGDLVYTSQKKIIECLEKMGKSAEAIAEVSKMMKQSEVKSSEVIAKLGNEFITKKDIIKYYGTPGIKKGINLKNEELTPLMIKDYLFYKMMYRKAERMGYSRSLAMQLQFEKVKRQLLAEEMYQREYFSRIDVTEQEVRNFYFKNKNRYKNGVGGFLPLSQVREQVRNDTRNIRSSEQRYNLVKELSEAEQLKVLVNLEGKEKKQNVRTPIKEDLIKKVVVPTTETNVKGVTNG